ncbi:TPA: tRNA dimethylallyltransferase, partial [Burkholderia cepacia]
IAPDATARALDALERVLDGGTPA